MSSQPEPGRLDRFAELAVRVGANVQPGQLVGISANIDTVSAFVNTVSAADARILCD